MICRAVGDTVLYAVCFKVGVADFHRDAGRELPLLAEFGGELLRHGDQCGF